MNKAEKNEITQEEELKRVKHKLKDENNSFECLKNLLGILKDEISDEQFKEMIEDAHR